MQANNELYLTIKRLLQFDSGIDLSLPDPLILMKECMQRMESKNADIKMPSDITIIF